MLLQLMQFNLIYFKRVMMIILQQSRDTDGILKSNRRSLLFLKSQLVKLKKPSRDTKQFFYDSSFAHRILTYSAQNIGIVMLLNLSMLENPLTGCMTRLLWLRALLSNGTPVNCFKHGRPLISKISSKIRAE